MTASAVASEDKLWAIYDCMETAGELHVAPIGDRKRHQLRIKCRCRPSLMVVGEAIIVIHNAFDFREIVEWLNEKEV